MVKIIEPKIETAELKSDGTYGRFVAEPLDRGFGTTLGNSLRRVLLSSLPGVAVISVKIDGIQHEFSTIPGVKEDVTEIILNIKGLTAKLYTDGPKTVVIDAEGECEVTAGSIETDAEVEILDPSMHIATLGEGAKLHMEITLKKGQGYVSAERNKTLELEKAPLGTLAVDSIYTRCSRSTTPLKTPEWNRLPITTNSQSKSGPTEPSPRRKPSVWLPRSSIGNSTTSSTFPTR